MKYNEYRRASRKIKVGGIYVGGDAPIPVQSMTNTKSDDFDSTYAQIKALEMAGCDIVRMAVPDMESVKTVARLKESDISIPLVADIHFDYRLAVECAAAGIDKIRINPGNIGGDDRIKAVVDACRVRDIPIRIGVNSGSLHKKLLAKYGAPTPEALAESAMENVKLLEKFDFNNIIIAIKSSRPMNMIRANRILAASCDYPIHLGVTEAGTLHTGMIKSSVGIGSLLCDGIGDTIRVTLTDDPLVEVREGKALLSALGLNDGKCINIISCPTCGRTNIDIIGLSKKLESLVAEGAISSEKPITVAVMGCVVNGPGESREADIGIAGGNGEGLLFRHGEIIRRVAEGDIIDALRDEIARLNENTQ